MLIRNLTEKQAAEITGYSVHWFRARRHYGGGPSYRKIGRSPRYPEDELVKWLESYKVVDSHSELKARLEKQKRIDQLNYEQ